jgi:hypothetical protein
MPHSRRQLITIFAGAAGVLAAKPVLVAALQSHSPQPIPSPNAPNPNFPNGMNGPDNRPTDDKKQIDPRRQEEIKSDIQKLYSLASELKDQSDKTDLNATLSVTVIKRAQEIEKLAKKIKNLSQD